MLEATPKRKTSLTGSCMNQISAEKKALIEAAAADGFQVSSKQIDRWRLDKLLPAPQTVGRGKGLGVARVVDASSASQLIALARILRENRSLDQAAFRLWVGGYAIPMERLRLALGRLIQEPFRRFKAKTKVRQDDEISAFESTLVRRKSVPKTVQKKLRKESLVPLLTTIAQLGVAVKPEFTPEHKKRFAHEFEEVSGLARGRTETSNENVKPWLSDDSSDAMFEAMDLAPMLLSVVDDASDDDLENARTKYLEMDKLRVWAAYAKKAYGHAFGIESVVDGWLCDGSFATNIYQFASLLVLSKAMPEMMPQLDLITQSAGNAVLAIESNIAQSNVAHN